MMLLNSKLLRMFRQYFTPPRIARARWAGIALAAVLCVVVLFRLIAPYLISTALVRSDMETAISKWSGLPAAIGSQPEVQFWPTPRITLNDVTIRRPAPGGDRIVLHVDQLSASFSLLKALAGAPVFRDFHLLRPHISISRDDQGFSDQGNGGLMANAIRMAKSAGPSAQSLDENLNALIGDIIIEDGTLDLEDRSTHNTITLTSVNADIDWPSLAAGVRMQMNARFRDQLMNLHFDSRQPLLLLGGKNADANGILTMPIFSLRFSGIANLAANAFLSGQAEAQLPDIPALLSWTGTHLPNAKDLKSAAISAHIMTSDDNMRFDSLELTIDDAHATGIMDMSLLPDGTPKLAGTLAFDQLDARAFLAAFSLNSDPRSATPDTAFIKKLDVDLRLSASRAMFEPFLLSDVGASVLVHDGKAKFDIGDSTFENGQLTAHLDVADSGFSRGGNLQISIRDADLESAAARAGLQGPLPLGTGSLDLSLTTAKPPWETRSTDMSGSFELFANTGAIRQFDSATFRTLAASKPFFQISEASTGTFSYDRIDIKADFSGGLAYLRDATVTGPSQTLKLTGVIPYGTNSLALGGALLPTNDTDAAAAPPMHFFVGGSWPNPVISTISIRDTNLLQ